MKQQTRLQNMTDSLSFSQETICTLTYSYTDFKMPCDTWVHVLSLRLVPLVSNSVSREAN